MRSLRDRLREHSAGGSKANRFVRLYSEEVQRLQTHAPAQHPRYASFFDGLYYTCITYALPAIIECRRLARLNRAGGDYYPWNTESEIRTLMAWSNLTVADLEKIDLKTTLSALRSSRPLDKLIELIK